MAISWLTHVKYDNLPNDHTASSTSNCPVSCSKSRSVHHPVSCSVSASHTVRPVSCDNVSCTVYPTTIPLRKSNQTPKPKWEKCWYTHVPTVPVSSVCKPVSAHISKRIRVPRSNVRKPKCKPPPSTSSPPSQTTPSPHPSTTSPKTTPTRSSPPPTTPPTIPSSPPSKTTQFTGHNNHSIRNLIFIPLY